VIERKQSDMRCALLASLALAALAAPDHVSYRDHHLFNVRSDQKVSGFLRKEADSPSVSGMDFWMEPMKDKASDVHISIPPEGVQAMHALLKKNNVTYTVMDTDIERSFGAQTAGRKVYRRGRLQEFDYFQYHPYEEIIDWMRDIQAEYSSICELVHIGWSYEERELLGLKIFGDARPGKKSVLTNYGIHAREWLSPATG
ncbi:Zinc carboxypeptidase A 1, partial [Diplonema papillatum]